MLRGIPKLGVLGGIAGDTAPDHKCGAKEGATRYKYGARTVALSSLTFIFR